MIVYVRGSGWRRTVDGRRTLAVSPETYVNLSRRKLALLCTCLGVAAVGWLMIAADRFLSGRIGGGVLTLVPALVFGAQAVYWFRRRRRSSTVNSPSAPSAAPRE